jgi:hypothetical protein
VASACGEEARRGLGAKRGTPAKIEPGDRPPIPSVIAAVIAITPPPTPLAKMTSDTMPYTVKLIATFAQMGTPARSNTPAMIIAEDIRRDSSRREQARGSDRQMQLRDKDERHEPGNRDIRERVKSESQCQIKRCALK